MKRRFLHVLSVILLLLSVGVAGLWVRSYRTADIWSWRCRDMRTERDEKEWYTELVRVVSSRGLVVFNWEAVKWEKTLPNFRKPRDDWHWEFFWDHTRFNEKTEFYDLRPASRDEPTWAARGGFETWDEERMILWRDDWSQFTPTRNVGFRLPH